MKSEIITLGFLLAIGLFSALVVASEPIATNLPVTIIIGMPGNNSTGTTSTTTITINNPANISFRIAARDETAHSKLINITLYDSVGHHFLNTSQFTGLGYLFSPTSVVDFEFDYDNRNLDVSLNGLNLTNLDGVLSQITIQNVNPQNVDFIVYRAYKLELPSSFSYSSIFLKMSLSDLSGINYGNISVYRCDNFNTVSNTCSVSWLPQTITANSANKFVSLNINHFSVYAVGSGSGSTLVSQTTTTTQITTTTSTSTSTVANSVQNSGSTGGSGGGGGGGGILPDIQQTATATETPTTTTTVLIIKRNDTAPSTSQTSQTAPITGFLGLTNIINPILVVAVVIVASVAAISWMKNKYTLSRLEFWKKSYHTFPSSSRTKKGKGKKNTQLKLSL